MSTDPAQLGKKELHVNNHDTERLLRLREVLSLIPVSRATWYAGVKSGRFPSSVHLAKRCVAWRYSEIQRLMRNGGRGHAQ